MKKALITGIAGFAGSHLAELLLAKNIQVFGFFLKSHSTVNIDHLKQKIKLIACDLLDKEAVESHVKSQSPDYVFHLAAFSSPAQSFIDPAKTLENNIIGEINLLQSLIKIKSAAKILIIGSSDEYGNVDQKTPVDENTPLAPLSPYAVSKVAQDLLAYQFFIHDHLPIVRVRPFNHIGPRQSRGFVVADFAGQIARLEKEGGGEMHVGNLAASRDFTDVRDIVRAYLLALEKAKTGQVYNLGSGKAVKIATILNTMLSYSKTKIKVVQDKTKLRSVEHKTIVCDFSKFHKACGWKPQIPLSKSLFDTIEYERKK